jgi:hypothetical protein
MKLQLLLEELLDKKISNQGKVWKNPTRKELHDAYNESAKKEFIRFVAINDSKDVYVFSADFVHSQFYSNFDINGTILDGTVKMGNLFTSPLLLKNAVTSPYNKKAFDKTKKILDTDWSWLNKYFRTENFLEKVRKNFERINKKR